MSLPMVACPTVPVGTVPGQSVAPIWAATNSACDGSLAVKLCTALGVLDTPLAVSIAEALQNSPMPLGRLVAGTNPVSLTPSELVPVMRIDEKFAALLISNRYVNGPAGPVLPAFATRNAGRRLVCVPVSGAIGTG